MERHKSLLNHSWTQSGNQKLYQYVPVLSFNNYPNSVRVTFILHNRNTSQVVPAPEALRILEQSNAQAALLGNGVEAISSFVIGKLN